MKKTLIFLLSIIALSVACKKDTSTPEIPQAIATNYSNLEVGNYWIYQHYNLDADGNYTALNIYDSLYIEKDTLIDGNTYFKYWTDQIQGGSLYPIYLRDSAEYTVQSDGSVFFANTSVTDTVETFCYLNFSDTLYCSYVVSSPNESLVNVPAGEFVCKNLATIYSLSTFSVGMPDRIRHRFMSKDIGMVYETLLFYYVDPNYRVRKLVSYGKVE